MSTTAHPARRDRLDGARRRTSTRRRRGSGRTFSATLASSPRARRGLPRQRGELELSEEDDLVLKLDAIRLPRPTAGLRHQRECVLRAGIPGVLDEVRVPWRDLRAADAVTLQAARLEHPAGAQLVLRVLEHASVRLLVRGLGGLALGLQLRDEA